MKSERLGMVMIPTTLAVIAVIAALLFERQVAARRVAIRDEGVGLVRLLSRLPYDQLVANRAGSGLLHAVLQSRNSPELGYGVIVDTQGALLAEVTSAGTLVPAAPAAGEAFTRVGERTLSSPGDERRITEFFGPLVADGKPAGLVRVGLFEPERNPFRTEQVSFLAVLALAVFLPVPLFYFVLKREMRPLRDLLQDVFDEVAKNAHGKDLRLECDLPPELAPVLLDKDLFRIAICNILSNAIKYNRPGGTVLLAADETDTQVRIRVRDSGIGIAPEDQGKVFDKFFRSANAAASGSSGHGLGLYLAREIAELHHGRITVASEPGRGTEFCVQLTKTPALLQEAVRL